MQQIKKRQAAYQTINLNGFTFLEALVTLLIVAIISSLLPLFYHTVNKTFSLYELTKTSEWFLFHSQIMQEALTKPKSTLNVQQLCFPDQARTVCYNQSKNVYRRQVNGLGHEVLLTNIKEFHIKEESETYILSFTFLNSIQREMRLPKNGGAK